MKKIILASLLSVLLTIVVLFVAHRAWASGPLWAKSYGGLDEDFASSVQETSDGGFIVAGYTDSYGAGQDDFWVLKLDGSGNVIWQKSYGGPDDDVASSVQETSDGGFIVAGYTESYGAGQKDCWVLKLDASGNLVWQKSYGGPDDDSARSVRETSDGGFIVGGSTESYAAWTTDFWVLKLDASGNVVWQKTYPGYHPASCSVQETSDGGFIVAGKTDYYDAWYDDCWVLKLDASGNVIWQKIYVGDDVESASSVQETSDGGFIVAGSSEGWSPSRPYDSLVLKLDASGNVIWQKRYGGPKHDHARSVQETSDGGFIVAGDTYSYGAGTYDFWVLKLDGSGNVVWQKTYGGSYYDLARSVQETSDGGFIVAGYTVSYGPGGSNSLVLKLDGSGEIPHCNAIGSSDATVINTSAEAQATSAVPNNTSATVSDTAVSPQDTSAEISVVCSVPLLDRLILIRQKRDLLRYKVQVYDVPTTVGGNIGPPIVSDNNIGKNVLDIAGGDWDGYAGNELVVMRGTPGKARKLFIYSMPEEVGGNTGPPIASDRWFGKYRDYMTVGNFDDDPEPEVAAVQYVSAKDIYRLFTYDMPTTVDGDTGPAIASDRNIGGNVIGIAAANFDADPEDELVIVRLRADGTHRLQIYDVPATVGGNTGPPIVSDNNIGRYIITCGVAAGNFDDDPEPEVAVVRLLASGIHKLVIYDAPTSVGGDTGPPIATDNNIGKNSTAIAACIAAW